MSDPKFHFYDIECLRNIFTMTVYRPERNDVEQYYLTTPDFAKKLQAEPNLLTKLTDRVNLRNHNFTAQRQIIRDQKGNAKPGNGKVILYDLTKPINMIRLAYEFGLSNAADANNPFDLTNTYPAGLRLTADTDLPNGEAKWNTKNVNQAFQKLLNNILNDNQASLNKFLSNSHFYQEKQLHSLASLHYQKYDDSIHPYLVGYNSYNYDLTLLAVLLSDAFSEIEDPASSRADIYSASKSGLHFYHIEPDKPEILRNVNNAMFSSKYIDNMPSILFKVTPSDIKDAPDEISFRDAYAIRKNMLRSGRHLDAAKLNEKLNKVGLKRLLGMKGYQILQSDKLRPGTDSITDLDQFYELLAYNASDCINLAELFEDNQYYGNFVQKKQLLHDYPMTVYAKKANSYAPQIAPDSVKHNRMNIDSTSAQIATNVVCPYGHLNDIPAVKFLYPEIRKAKETGIKQFNVLDLTKEFFNERVYQPALKINKRNAEKALNQFNKVMNFYSFIQSKNFNDSANYYRKQLSSVPQSKKATDLLNSFNDQDFAELFSRVNTFEWFKAYQIAQKGTNQIVKITDPVSNTVFNLPVDFVKRQKLAPVIEFNEQTGQNKPARLTINDLIWYLKQDSKSITDLIDQLEPTSESFDKAFANLKQGKNKKQTVSSYDFNKLRKLINQVTKTKLGLTLTLGVYENCNLTNQQLISTKTGKKMFKLQLRPYISDDLPKDNYCLPFYNQDASPSAGFAVFSIGGVHGAEYDQKLYRNEHANFNKKHASNQQLDLFSNNNNATPKYTDKEQLWLKRHDLFRVNESGLYELNKRYTFTSIDYVNHEDFSSYYPSMCRMLNVYWNDGIGYDIYGTIYDKKEKLGTMMKDKKYTPDQRAYFKTMRQGTKLILNSTTGKGDSHGQNSPIQMNNNIISMRLIGQMFTWRIGQAQTLLGAKCISTNTDGIYTVLDDVELNAKSLAKESKTIHVRIDPERLYLISKDTNNRIESNAKTLDINNVSGGDLRAFNGPTTTGRLAHPAAIDHALGVYLKAIGDPKSPYYDKDLRKDFNLKLGLHILQHLLKNDVKNKDLALSDKQKLLNLFQNIIASSPGSVRYIFTTHKLFNNINGLSFIKSEQRNNPVYADLFGSSSIFDDNTTIGASDLNNIQQYNRVFYVKDNAFTHNLIQHVYVASGKKIPARDVISRRKNGRPAFENSDVASHILQENGVDLSSLNNSHREASVVRLPSLPYEWNTLFINDDLRSLSPEFIDKLLDSLDYRAYLELFTSTYIKDWSNNIEYKDLKGKTLDKHIKTLVDLQFN